MGGRGSLQRRARPLAPAVRRRAPAAQRDRRAAHRACAAARDRRHRDPHEEDAGLQHALPAGLRPRRYRDAERRRECAAQRRDLAPGDRPRGVRGARVGVAARVRRQDPEPVPPHGRIARLPADAIHDGRRLHPRGDAVLRPSLPPRLDLPRQPDHQLVPAPRDVPVGSRAGAPGRGRHAHDDPVSARGRRRVHRDRDCAAGDDSRGRRRGRASGRRALSPSDRPRGDRAVGRAPRPGDRRRAGRARVRHRRAEDHAGARPDRLRDRTRSRAAGAELHRPGRPRHGRRARGALAEGGRRTHRGLGQGTRPARAARALPAQRRRLRALQDPHRAADLAAVVVRDGRDQAACARRPAGAPDRLPPREPAPLRDRLAGECARLEHLAADLVGASDPGVVLPRRPSDRRRVRAGGLR